MSNVHITSLDKNLAPHLLVYSEAPGLLSDIDASSFAVETHMVILFWTLSIPLVSTISPFL